MSFYKQYLEELTSDFMLETEKGFATYRFPDANTVYILDIYVSPDFRQKGTASEIADKIVEIAKKQGCTKVIGSVVPSRRGSTTSLKALLGWGMSLDSCANDFILLKKEVV